jgi:hypothetical protein
MSYNYNNLLFLTFNIIYITKPCIVVYIHFDILYQLYPCKIQPIKTRGNSTSIDYAQGDYLDKEEERVWGQFGVAGPQNRRQQNIWSDKENTLITNKHKNNLTEQSKFSRITPHTGNIDSRITPAPQTPGKSNYFYFHFPPMDMAQCRGVNLI